MAAAERAGRGAWVGGGEARSGDDAPVMHGGLMQYVYIRHYARTVREERMRFTWALQTGSVLSSVVGG